VSKLPQRVNTQTGFHNHILFSSDAMVSLQMIPSVDEGRNFRVNVFLKTPRGGNLDCDLVVTLILTNGTAIGKHA